jgi:hypothetical protein
MCVDVSAVQRENRWNKGREGRSIILTEIKKGKVR